jgi:hypothetical protein
MWQRKSSHFSRITEHIGKLLRRQFDDVPRELLPERWVHLINYLNAQERDQAEAGIEREKHPKIEPQLARGLSPGVQVKRGRSVESIYRSAKYD